MNLRAVVRACVAILACAVAACTRVGGPATTGGNAWTHHGLLRIVDQAEPDNLDPIVGNYQIDADLAQLWGGMLFNWNDRNELDPELATEVPTLRNGGISADGKTIVYHLRRGVTWHDGKPFDADDVIFTYHAVMNKKNNVPSTVGYALVTRIDRRDDHTIAVHLSHAFSPFVATFFAPSGTPFPILPEHVLGRYADINTVPFNSRPIGTGPFVIDRWQRGNKISFNANPHYWRGRPKLDRVWYTPIPNENTIVTLLQSHQADLAYEGSPANYEQLAHIAGTTAVLTPFTEYSQYALNLRTPALADVRVRRALWYALDVPRLLHDVTHDVNVPGSTDQPDFLWAHNANVAHYADDPGKARELLDAAGWHVGADGIRVRAGQRLSLVVAAASGNSVAESSNVIVQRAWHDVGVDVQIKTYTTSLYFSTFGANGILQTGKFDVAYFRWINGTDPDDSVNWMCDQFPPAGQNVYHYCNPKVDGLERIALASNDRAVRKRAYDGIQALLADDVPAIIPWYFRRIAVYNSDLANFRPAHAVSSFWNAYDWSI